MRWKYSPVDVVRGGTLFHGVVCAVEVCFIEVMFGGLSHKQLHSQMQLLLR